MNVLDALHVRRSSRFFLPRTVPQSTVEAVLRNAVRAPSMINAQPWRVHVLAGDARERICDAVLRAHREGGRPRRSPLVRIPANWRDTFRSRHGARAWERNFEFHGAPVGLLLTTNHHVEPACLLDLGIFLQSVMLAASGFGLSTCPQVAWTDHEEVLRPLVPLRADEALVCGVALGFADDATRGNVTTTPRRTLDEIAAFSGF